jgi:phage gp45-like
MVMRTTLTDTARRAQTNASRATIRDMNTKPYWSEATHVDVMKSETHTDVEFAENYGSTSRPAKQDEDENKKGGKQSSQQSGGNSGAGGGGGGAEGEQGDQPEGDAAEAIILYLNGSRSHPVIISAGDRRHRLVELEEGDVAQHRMQEDRQQFLLSKDGTYLTTRNDKVMRIALVEKETKDQGQEQQQTRGAGPGEGQQGGKKKKTYGQKSAKDDNKKSQVAIEQNGTQTYSQHGQFYTAQRGGSDASTYFDNRKKSSQATQTHVHMRFEDNRIWVDEEGHWSEMPIQQKKDRHCKD